MEGGEQMKFPNYRGIKKFLNINIYYLENVKTVLLWMLVLLSLLLTWALWTYKPSYEVLKNQSTIESVQIDPSGKRKISEVITPLQIIHYSGGENYSLLKNEEQSEKLYQELLDAPYTKDGELRFSDNRSLKEPNNFIELIFANDLSKNLLVELFEIDEEHALISDVQRLYLFERKTDDISKVYLRLISYKQKRYMDLEIQINYQEIVNRINHEQMMLDYFNYYVRDENGSIEDIIYLPKNKVEMLSHPIKYVQKTNVEDFRNALFGDPSFVNREDSIGKVNFTDGKQVLSVSLDTYKMAYRSIVTDTEDQLNTEFDKITGSIQFVNKHYGWTDQYILFGERNEDEITFRLNVDGIPVFNDLGIIQLQWDKGNIYEYNRSLINISYEYPREFLNERINEKIDRWPPLMSGYELIDILRDEVGLSNVKDIQLGYEMTKYNNSSSFYEFSPNWYYYDGDYWLPIDKQLGGKSDGLEED
jgi:regulatory protein YycH of two-component signal transduction system YycFG